MRSYSRVTDGNNAVDAQLRAAHLLYASLDDQAGALQHLREFGIANPRYNSEMLVGQGEILVQLDRKDEACGRYESLSNALISPTAIYRYAECLEDQGDADGARKEYREIIRSFRDTPEAVLAAGGREILAALAEGTDAEESLAEEALARTARTNEFESDG